MKFNLIATIYIVLLLILLFNNNKINSLELLVLNDKSNDWESLSLSEGNQRIITNCYLRNHETKLFKVNLNEQDDHLALIQITHNQFINSNPYLNEYENIIIKSYTYLNNSNSNSNSSNSNNIDGNEILTNINNKTSTNNDKIEISITDITPISINSCFEKEIYFSVYLNNYFFGGDIEVSIASLYDKTQCYEKKNNKKILNTFIKRF